MNEQQQQQQENLIILTDPYFIQQDNNDSSIEGVTLSNLLQHPGSIFDAPIAISHMLQQDLYDVTQPSNFVHFGSLSSRIEIFYQKYKELYQQYNSQLDNHLIKDKVRQLILKFDKYQRHLLYQSGAIDIQTDGTTITTIQWHEHSDILNWLKSKRHQVALYDEENIHRLLTFLPEAILMDPRNIDLIKLIQLLGNAMDQYWAAIKAIPKLTTKLQHELQFYSLEFLKEVLINYGIDFNINYSNHSIVEYYGRYEDSGTINPEIYNRRLLARLASNAPFLLRGKGTKGTLQQLLRIYGLSQELVEILQLDNRKDPYNKVSERVQSRSVYVTRPYYYASNQDPLIIENITENTIIVHCRTPNGIIGQQEDIEYQIEKQYMFYIYDGVGKVYCEGELTEHQYQITPQYGVLEFDYPLYIDKIIIADYDKDYSEIYATGSNVIYKLNDISVIFDFNRIQYEVKNVSNIIVNSNANSVRYGEFVIFHKQNIFPQFIDAKNNYQVIHDIYEEDELVKLDVQNTTPITDKPNLSTILIGSSTSQRFNNMFLEDNQKRVQDLLDTTQFLNPGGKWSLGKYPMLQDYKEEYYEEGLSIKGRDDSSYKDKVTFYQNLDDGLFKLVRGFLPATVTPHVGLIIDNDILTRNKIPVQKTPFQCQGMIAPSDQIQYKHPMRIPQQNFNPMKTIPIQKFNYIKSIEGTCRNPKRMKIKTQTVFRIDDRRYKAYGTVQKVTTIKQRKMIVTDKGLRITSVKGSKKE